MSLGQYTGQTLAIFNSFIGALKLCTCEERWSQPFTKNRSDHVLTCFVVKCFMLLPVIRNDGIWWYFYQFLLKYTDEKYETTKLHIDAKVFINQYLFAHTLCEGKQIITYQLYDLSILWIIEYKYGPKLESWGPCGS